MNYRYATNVVQLDDNLINALRADDQVLNGPDCESWCVIDEVKLKCINIVWKNLDCGMHRELTVKEFVRARLGKGNAVTGPLYGREKSVKNIVGQIKNICNAVDGLFGKTKRLDQLKLEDVKDILIQLSIRTDTPLQASGTIDNYAMNFRYLAEFYSKGLVSDGISCQLPNSQMIKMLLKEHVESTGINYYDWERRGSWHNLSIDSALLMLDYHISVVESNEALFLSKFYTFQRSKYRVNPKEIHGAGRFSSAFENACLKMNRKSTIKTKITNLERLAKLFIEHGMFCKNNKFKANFKPSFFVRTTSFIKQSAMFVFVALSGIRMSELASVRYKNFFRKNNIYYFDSAIKKTNKGIKRTRPISEHGYNAMKIAASMSYLPMEDDVSPFASRTHFPVNFHDLTLKPYYTPSAESQGKNISNAYVKAVKDNPKLFKGAPSTTSAHALRHIFAAIALRAFTGNIRDHVRRYYCHTSHSKFTRAYVEGKLDDALLSATQTDFFKQFVESVGGTDPDFFAAIAKRIRERVQDEHVFATPDEMSEFFAKEAVKTCELVGHEFGYFIPWKLGAGEFDVHHLTAKSSPEDTVRIAISHQHLINSCEDPIIRDASAKVVEMCEKMLTDLNVDLSGLQYE